MNNLWKMGLGIVVAIFFFGIGVAHVINPDRFIERSAVRKGGELLTKWNRLQFRIVGVIFAGFAALILYVLLSDYFSN
jgi:hypothetical protein